jgi:hypothetical protein
MSTSRTKPGSDKPELDSYERQEFNQKLRKILFCSGVAILSQPVIYTIARRTLSLAVILLTVIPPVVLFITYRILRKPRVIKTRHGA